MKKTGAVRKNPGGKLPDGWAITTLGEIVKPSRSRAAPSETPDIPFVGLEHIESQTMRIIGHKYASDVRSSALRFAIDDVLYSRMRPYLNKVWIADFDGLCSAEFLVFPTEGVSSAFLGLRLNADDFVAFANAQISGERPRVSFEKLSKFTITLPPLAEQERIVAGLSAPLTRMAAGMSATQRALNRLERYRSAVFHAAVTGDLTVHWRKTDESDESGSHLLERILKARRTKWEKSELRRLRATGKEPKNDKLQSRYTPPEAINVTNLPPLPDKWTYASVEQVGFVQLGRQRTPKDHRGKSMRPYLRVANVFEDRIDLSDVKQMNFTAKEFEVFCLEKNDILLNEGQSLELVGRPALYRGELPGGCFQNTLIRFRACASVEPKFAMIVFRAFLRSGRFQQIAKQSTNIAHLGADRFAKMEFPLPPKLEQKTIIREVERRLKAADRLSRTLYRQLERARATRQSLFREAFTGRLVPQNLQDEPAEISLERIRVSRQVQAKKPKEKRMPKSKSRAIQRPLLEVLQEHKRPITPEQLFRKAGFQPADADLFYRELASLRKIVRETKPSAAESKSWPTRARVLLEIKER
jgi:type I restriction enzyme S subunit